MVKRNHNPKKVTNYLEMQERQKRLAQEQLNELRKGRVKANTLAWVNSIPYAVREARVSTLHEATKKKIKSTRFTEPFEKMVVVTSEKSTNGIYVNYAILRSLVMSGIATPSEIRITSLLEGYNNINGMFQARNWKEYFFDPKAKVLVIEGASLNLARLNNKGETQFWRELREFTRNNDKLVIISYVSEPSETEKGGLIPVFSSDRALNTSLLKECSFIMMTNEEEEKVEHEQSKVDR